MYDIKITVNSEDVYLTEFPGEIIKNVLLGILKSLKGVEDIQEAKIELTETK